MRSRRIMLAAGVAALLAAAPAIPASAALPELGKWRREGKVFSDTTYNNVDVVATGDGRWRAYFMVFGEVRSAISDDGRVFTVEDGVRVAGSHPALVRLPGGRLRMYYVSADPADEGAILSATSDDGLSFTPEAGVRLRPGRSRRPDEGGIIHPSVVRRPNESYRMYYDAVGPGGGPGDWRGIRSASSRDGLSWTKDRGYRVRAGRNPIGFAALVWSPFVERSGKRYKLYFSLETDRKVRQRVGIYLATSRYGLDFTIHADRPMLGLDPKVKYPHQGEGGMTGLPQDAFVIRVDGGKRLFYWQVNKGTLSAFLAL